MPDSLDTTGSAPALSRVLLIEDDSNLEEILSDGLQTDNIALSSVKTGREALNLIQREPVGLVLLDLGLPEKDGFEVLQELKNDPAGEHVPVIILTAWRSTQDKLRGFELGAVDYITKPFDLAELRARVRTALRARKLHEDLLQANRDLDAARLAAETTARSKTDFLANMSHEIRTPMNGVIAMTGLLLQTELNSEQRDFVETIRSSGESLLSIINDILNFSKIESGKLEVEREPLDLRACVEEALDVLAAKAAEKNLDLGYQLEDPTPTQVIGDAMRIRQILVNLVGNAIKFTERGEVFVLVEGTPRASSSQPLGASGTRHDQADPPRWEFHFSVRDTGIGIPEDRLGRLFKSFSQVDSSITRMFGGTGLGLAISRGLVELMGGRMWVESKQGEGSTFHFTLPLPAVGGPSASTTFRPRVAGKRVLIVDDNPTHRRILTGLAQRWSMTSCAIESPSQALDIVRRGERFDFAVIDIYLPGMGGVELTEQLRQVPGVQSLPVLLMTPLGMRIEVPPSSGGAFTTFLNKPIKPAQLQAALVQLVSGARPVPPQALPASKIDPHLAKRHPLRVLLTDDNQINQKVASRLLKQLGFTADLASNGLEAIQALEREPYDLVFMDVQMPEMDGLEATRRIRQRQHEEGAQAHFRRPIAIIAMTANAMQGDREKCLAAGMDDYIPKPIRPEALQAAIERFGPRLKSDSASQQAARTPAAAARALPPKPALLPEAAALQAPAPCPEGEVIRHTDVPSASRIAPPVSSPRHAAVIASPPFVRTPPVVRPASAASLEAPVDLDRLSDFSGGEPGAMQELVNLWITQTSEQVEQIEAAIQARDAATVARIAHSCAGASGTCGMVAVVPALRRMEALGDAGDLIAVAPQLAAVKRELDRTLRYLQTHSIEVPQTQRD